jgi:hypothetical protein
MIQVGDIIQVIKVPDGHPKYWVDYWTINLNAIAEVDDIFVAIDGT